MLYSSIMHIPQSKDAFMTGEHELTLRLTAQAGDLSKCVAFYGDRVCPYDPIKVMPAAMSIVASDGIHDYFEAVIDSELTRICYYFQLTDKEGEISYYSESGFDKEIHHDRTQYFQFPYLRRENLGRIPDWSYDIVMYHIFPDSFASGKNHIDRIAKKCTLKDGLTSYGKNGGTIKGITESVSYIASMGFNCIYLNPVFRAASYHKYDIIDYMEIDPCLGDKEDLKRMVSECHKYGIRVILDGVFNHCGSGFFAFRDVLQNQERSKYKDWFYKLNFPVKYTDNPNYETFAYVKEMPKLNTSNTEVVDYFCKVGRYWIKETDIDGWRLDVANEVDHDFWRAFRNAVRAEKKDVFLIGEIWEDSSVWLMGDQFDSTMNYRFSNICRDFFARQKIKVSEFDHQIQGMLMRYSSDVALAQMNFLDTHDIPRFFSSCNGDTCKLKMAVFFLMTAPGVPSVFYGDECCLSGITESEYRQPMQWDCINDDMTEFFRHCITARNNHIELRRGNYRTVLTDDEKKIYMFERSYQDITSKITIDISRKTCSISYNDETVEEF